MTDTKAEPKSEKIIPRIIEQEMKTSYLDYSMSVIVGRALPDVRDGLKPVHRRILYAMYDMGMLHHKPFKKSARIVGEILGKYHPHGDMAVYDAMVRLAQDFSLRYPLVDGQGNFGCFTKDTKVKLTDRRELSFGELVEEFNQGKLNFTFTVTENGTIAIAEIKHPRLTKKDARLVKVILDNGAEIKCTPDHRFMLLDGSYKEAKDLLPGVSLMPGYFRLSQKDENPNTAGYEMVFQPSEKAWEYCHKLADEWNLQNGVYAKSAGRVRHHVDFNKLNNSPLNIQRMHWGAHLKHHAGHAARLHENEEYRTKIAAGRAEYWSDKAVRREYAKRISERNKQNWQDNEYREHMRKMLSDVNKAYIAKHPEKRKEYSKRASVTLKRLWKDSVYKKLFHEKIVASNKRRITNNTGKTKFLRICHASLAKYELLNESVYELIRQEEFGQNFTTWGKGIKKYFNNDTKALYAELCHNHKVSKVESLVETADVYDLTIDKTHNFLLAAGVFVHNSVDGDRAAAMRYTEARLNKLAEEILQDIDKEAVDFVPNYDASLQEPSVLPAKVPNLLINGSSGIAVGMATNIPPHNMIEVCDGIIKTIDNPEIDVLALMQTIKAPDFPTGGIIMGGSGLKEAYKTGHGKITVRAKTQLEETKTRTRIIVTEIPYMVNKAEMIEAIADLVRDKKVQGIADLRDESDRDGMRIVIDLKQGANSDVVLNQLFAHSRLQETFGINMLALVDNQPKILTLKDIIQEYINYRRSIVRKRTEFDLRQAEDKAHILEGLIIALDHIDPVILLIKRSKSADEAKKSLIGFYHLSEKQAQAVLDMTLRRLTSLEQDKIRSEHADLLKLIKELKDILASEVRILGIIKAELLELKEKYGNARKTQLIESEVAVMEEESLIKPEDDVITITHAGYVKRLTIDTYKQQRRGGKGIIAAETKEEDFIENLFVANTHDYILFFTNLGKVHWIKVYQLPEASRYAKGTAIVNLLQLGQGEKVTAFIPVKQFEENKFLFMVTANGTVKKTSLAEFSNPRKGGIIALGLDEKDELKSVMLTDGSQQIIIATKQGMAVKFQEGDVRPMGRTATGVIGIRLREDSVVGATIADDKLSLVTVTENGYGKRSPISEYRLINRGGVGVINIKITDKNGQVVSIAQVTDNDELMLISQSGVLIRTPVTGISVIGRNTQGVRVMRLDEKDKVISLAKIVPEEE